MSADPEVEVSADPEVGQRWRRDGVTEEVAEIVVLDPGSAWEIRWKNADVVGAPVRYARDDVAMRGAVVWPPLRAERVYRVSLDMLEAVAAEMRAR